MSSAYYITFPPSGYFFCPRSKIVSRHIVLVRPPLWSSGQSSWLQIQRSEHDSRLYQIFWEVVGLERDPLILVGLLSLVSTLEEILVRKSSAPV
jgi:hypothetical protein